MAYYYRRKPYQRRRHYRRRNYFYPRRHRAVRHRRKRGFPYLRPQKRRRTRTLHVTDPRYKAYCNITGWVPIAMTRVPLISMPFSVQTTSPFYVYPGGYGYGVFTLDAMYKEHLVKRNRWSRSNAGFDLGRYIGTTLTLVPHPVFDYIFYYDPEYGNTLEFKKLLHPAIMITHPKSILVLSNKRGGSRRKWPKVWIPRPAIYGDGWEFQKDLAQQGLFAFGWSWIDLDRPWMTDIPKPTAAVDPSTYIQSQDQVNQQPQMWWKDANNNWLQNWGTNGTQANNKIAMSGPFVLKTNKVDYVNYELPQIILFYKSKFQWGGEFLQDKTLANPNTIPPQQQYFGEPGTSNILASPDLTQLSSGLQDGISGLPWASPPKEPNKYTTRPEDYDSDGILTDESFRRITDSPYNSDGGNSFSSFSTASEPGAKKHKRPLGGKSSRDYISGPRKRRRRTQTEENEETNPVPSTSRSEPTLSRLGEPTKQQLLRRFLRRLLTHK